MTEKGREMYLTLLTILIGGILAGFKIITGDQWITLATYYAGGTTALRMIYKLIKNGSGNEVLPPVVKDQVEPDGYAKQ